MLGEIKYNNIYYIILYIFIIVISFSWIGSFDHYVVSLFVSFHGLYFKVYFI